MEKSVNLRQKAARHGFLCVLLGCLAGPAWSQPAILLAAALPDAPTMGLAAGQDDEATPGTIRGTVVDQNGHFVVGAQVKLAQQGPATQEVVSDRAGHFAFLGVAPGPFQLTITCEGFAITNRTGILRPGEWLNMLEVTLPVGGTTTDIEVNLTYYELAEEQVRIEETQRVLGVVPNFYVTYNPDALPLRPRQKFELAWKTAFDPVTFAATGVIAGIEQQQNLYSGYGQGAQGYAKRYGASYADAFGGILIGGAILPTLFKQDPRYFYKGTGSKRSRILYALANAVICKGDNGHWQVDYSGILGSLASGGISNLYYPASSRNGAGLTFENTLIGIGGSGVSNIFQEFLIRKLTPHARGNP